MFTPCLLLAPFFLLLQGYRDAQCAWLQLPAHVVARLLQLQPQQHTHTPRKETEVLPPGPDRVPACSEPPPAGTLSSLLVLWAPRRQTLEVRYGAQAFTKLATSSADAHMGLTAVRHC